MKKLGILFTVVLVLITSGCMVISKRSLISSHSSKCLSLDVFGGYYDGDPAQQWDCNHYHMGLQASWELFPVGQSDTYRVRSFHSGKCLEVDLSSGGKNNGDIVRQAKCTGADNQHWVIMLGQQSTTIKSVYSGKCAEVKLGTTNGMQDGDAIQQSDCTGADNQSWMPQSITAPTPPLDTGQGQLCNVCNPANPVCKTGALCLVMTSGQTICGQSCSTVIGCPSGYMCTPMTQLGKTVFQCVPDNNQCP